MDTNNKVIVIAEAGVNHNGSLERAFEMIDVAADAEADYVKFQSFRADHLVTKTAAKAEYQKVQTNSQQTQYDMLKALELDNTMHQKILERCGEKGIAFLSTPFDHLNVNYLVEDCGLSLLKISSGDLTNPLILLEAARTNKKIIISTGMATMSEIENALSVLAFGYLNKDEQPSRDAFRVAWMSKIGRDAVKQNVVILHCTTEYPTPFQDVNLNAMRSIYEAFGVPVGYSDHTLGTAISIAAVALGAVVIEKHFTLDKSLDGPDHAASLEPDELNSLVSGIRAVEHGMGSTVKVPAESEVKNIAIARKSLVASAPIAKGTEFTDENITIKRPGTGLDPMMYWEMIGNKAEQDYLEDQVII